MNFLQNFFKIIHKPWLHIQKMNKNKDNNYLVNSKYNNKEEEENLILEKENFNIKRNESNIFIYHNNILKIVPLAYFLVKIFSLIALLVHQKNQNFTAKTFTITVNHQCFDYFDLQNLNSSNLVHFSSLLSFVLGLTITYLHFSILNQRFKVPEYKNYFSNVYLLLLLGLIANFLDLSNGYIFYLKDYNNYNLVFKSETKLDLNIAFFLIKNISSLLFSIYSLYVMNFISSGQKEERDKCLYFKFRIFISLHFVLIIFIYCSVLFNKNDIYSFSLFESFIKERENIILGLLPYFIYIFEALIYLIFHFELQYLNLAVSQNIDTYNMFETGYCSYIICNYESDLV